MAMSILSARSGLLAVVACLACHGGGRPDQIAREASLQTCLAHQRGGGPAAINKRFSLSDLEALAGEYLVGVADSTRDRVELSGRLSLWATDDRRRFQLPPDTIALAGSTDLAIASRLGVSVPVLPSSRDSERPGVQVHRGGLMVLGNPAYLLPGPQRLVQTDTINGLVKIDTLVYPGPIRPVAAHEGVLFQIEEVFPDGFGGTWEDARLIGPLTRGRFCALRTRPGGS